MNVAWIALLLLAQTKTPAYRPGTASHPGGAPVQAPAGAPIKPMGGYGQRQPAGASGARGGNGARTVLVPVIVGVEPLGPPAPPPPSDPPAAIVNPGYQPEAAYPVLQDYSNVPLRESAPLARRQSEPPPARMQQVDQSPTIHLIAFKDGAIVAVLGYWTEGETLHYITRDATRNRVPLERVDREFSTKLNSERGLEFKLE